ncbi:MAG: long-chain fatty acid--CoA ligase [Opitutales bacterium]|nr:long-chain fatty acid--CoA ligase [Opitutales bacterium]
MSDQKMMGPMPGDSKNVAELYLAMASHFGDSTALVGHANANGERDKLSYDQLIHNAKLAAEGLASCGLQVGDRVMILADNRLEWLVTSMAITFAAGVDVPRGNDATHDEVNYILSHSASKFLVVENRTHLERVLKFIDELDALDRIVVMDGAHLTDDQVKDSSIITLEELMEKGKTAVEHGHAVVDGRFEKIKEDDPFTMIYTSGTTGRPKGVVLSHGNIMSQVEAVPVRIVRGWKALSILPIWHSYERTFELIAMARGIEMTYSSISTIGADMKEVKPHIMVSAPRLWENVYARIQHNVRSANIVRRGLFNTAYALAYVQKTALAIFTDQHLELEYISGPKRLMRKIGAAIAIMFSFLPHLIMDKLVFSKLRAVIGGRFVCTVSGGGALPLHIDEFFNYIGIPVLEGYGATETSPVLSVRRREFLVIGTVGPIWPNTDVRIVDPETKSIIYPDVNRPHQGRGIKGEIHVKGPQVMQGYFRSPEETEKVIHGDWFNTGDLGIITFNDCLKILGRTKDTVVLLSGENIEPVPIEHRIAESDLIENCMVVGQDQKYLGLLVVPSVEGFKEKDESLDSVEKIVASQEAKEWVQDWIHDCVSVKTGFKSFERVHSWRWIEKPFDVGDEITATFKLKRHVINKKYATIVESMFSHH